MCIRDRTKSIVKTANGAEADGVVVDVNSLVSMNMWGLTPDFLEMCIRDSSRPVPDFLRHGQPVRLSLHLVPKLQ